MSYKKIKMSADLLVHVFKKVSLLDLTGCVFKVEFEEADNFYFATAISKGNVIDSIQWDGNIFTVPDNSLHFYPLNPMSQAFDAIDEFYAQLQEGENEKGENTPNKKEIIEGNKLINTFEKGELFDKGKIRFYEGADGFQSEEGSFLLYHVSWSWFMPVWFKFRDLKLGGKACYKHSEFKEYIARAICYGSQGNYISAHAKLVEGIQWYNNLKKSN